MARTNLTNLSLDMTRQDHLLTCAENHGTIGKHADPTEGAREGLTVGEALDIASVDASLIWVDFEPNIGLVGGE